MKKSIAKPNSSGDCDKKLNLSHDSLVTHAKAKHEGVRHICEHCGYKAPKLSKLTKHIKAVHLKIKDYACEDCDAEFSSKSNLERHVNTKHKGIRYSCDQCEYKTTQSGRLTQHIDVAHLKIKDYTCEDCDEKFSEPGISERHVKVQHEGVRYSCEQCDYKAQELDTLRRHTKAVHLKVDDHTSVACDAKLSSKSSLPKHVTVKQQGVRHNCEECGYKAPKLSKLTKHIKAVHLKIKDYACEDCDAEFYSRSNLERHMNSKHKGIRYSCDQCDYKTTQSGRLTHHTNVAHLKIKDYTCEDCDKKFTVQSSLERHVRGQHEGVRYSCDQCDYTVKTLDTLKSHTRAVHLKIDDHICGVCDAKLSSKSSLAKHVKVQHEGFRYSCEQCDYTAKQLHTLKRHVRVVHLRTEAGGKKSSKMAKRKKDCDRKLHSTQGRLKGRSKMKKFSCDQCEFKTAYRHSLESHTIARHDGQLRVQGSSHAPVKTEEDKIGNEEDPLGEEGLSMKQEVASDEGPSTENEDPCIEDVELITDDLDPLDEDDPIVALKVVSVDKAAKKAS